MDGILVVILAGKLLHLVAHEYLAGTDRLLQTDSLQTGASRQSHVSLTTCKNSSREINLDLIESQPLTLVDGNCPGKSDRILLVSADFLFLNLLFHLVEMIAHVAPGSRFHHHILSILRAHIYLGIILIIEPDDGAQGTVHPLVLDIILDKDNLCSGLQIQFDRGRQTAFRKLALDIAPEECWLSWQEFELVLVDEIHGVTAGGEGDGKLGITLV